MLRHLPLILVTTFAAIVVTLHFSQSYWPETVEPPKSADSMVEKPDFSQYSSVAERKAAFFHYLKPYVLERNREILALRERIESPQIQEDELKALAKRYRIKSSDSDVIKQQLLLKIDAIPPSLVLAQAAMESAWGLSRFAIEGNNYFGQWCFTAGCGLVPESRVEGKQHEVRVFESPRDSVVSYMRNINSHPAYRELRATRTALREQGESYNGCFLATGLHRYSEKGDAYVESLKKLIRSNQLEQDPKDYCAPVLLATEEKAKAQKKVRQKTEKKSTKTDVATDDSQGEIPAPATNTQPSS